MRLRPSSFLADIDFRYEVQLLESSRQLVQEERASLVRRLVARRARGLAGHITSCSSCCQALQGARSCVVFPCSHSFHTQCLDRAGCLGLSDLGEEVEKGHPIIYPP